MKKLLFLITGFLLFNNHQLIADEDGRFRVTVLQQSGGAESRGKVFIIDSKEGHMWIWEDKSKFTTAEGKFAFGAKIVYQGKLKPGKKMGDIVAREIGP